MNISPVLQELGVQPENQGTSTGAHFFGDGPSIDSLTPVTGEKIASISTTTRADYERVMETAEQAFLSWRAMPAPKRGEIVRQFGDKLREKKGCPWQTGELRNGQEPARRLGRSSGND
jgi:aldehyde dehydrogenase (NAD+)